MIVRDYFALLTPEQKAQYKFDFCQLCPFYECELIKEKELLKENGSCLFENSCSMKEGFSKIECGAKTVSEGIGDHFKIKIDSDEYNIKTDMKDRWDPSQSVFISAQTGQGKNYFIENLLLPYVRDLNYKSKTDQKVLILSNRLALKQQIENRLKGIDRSDDEIYTYKDVADVTTYQSFLQKKDFFNKKQNIGKSRYIFVICDEAHFFTSDAMFNPHTQKILSSIIELFKDAVRVYMSATPYDCLRYISKYEKHDMVFYHFKRDYSYLDVKAYSKIDELYDIIVKSVNERQEKWLIFIDDKLKCADVKNNLTAYETKRGYSLTGKVIAVDADSKNDEPYSSMLLHEKLSQNTYVLIATSVLDNGVNLNGINHIVVSDMSPSKVLQMVGRARVSGPDDRKTVYIQRFDTADVNKRINNYKIQQDAYHNYELACGDIRYPHEPKGYEGYLFLNKYYYGRHQDWENAKRWFGISADAPAQLYLNEISKDLLEKNIAQYEAILSEMNEDILREDIDRSGQKKKIRPGQKYLEYLFAWFGKSYCEDDDITFQDKEKSKNEFITFLESYVEREAEIGTSEEINHFKTRFIELFDAAFCKSDKNGRKYGSQKMNELLQERGLNYRIDGKPQAGPWKVIRYENTPEK